MTRERAEAVSEHRTRALRDALAERILVLDGATGTALEAFGLTAEDYGGESTEGVGEALVLHCPDACRRLHETYLDAGCDIVETNTFGATALVLGEHGLGEHAVEINRRAAALAREACARFETPERPRFVAGSMGPTTRALSLTDTITFVELQAHYRDQARGLIEGGADYLLLETCQDTLNVKAGLLGIEDAFEASGRRIPIAVSVTIEPTGRMLAGQDVEALRVSLMHVDLLYLGLNCATGPEAMTDAVRTLAAHAATRIACVPNAGLPDEDGRYGLGADAMAAAISRFVTSGWLNLVGGCCGTTPDHVRALVEAVAGVTPRTPVQATGSWLSGIDALAIDEDTRPIVAGERTNVMGSRRFRRLVRDRRFEEGAEIARAQVRGGAHLIDVCLRDPDPEADEAGDLDTFLTEVVRKVRVPLMIDTTDPEVMERGLQRCQGKVLLNSANLEAGPERFVRIATLARRFGAALVVGLIDEDPEEGMAATVERKMAVATRAHRLLTGDLGLPEEDIYWDALVFPLGTGRASLADSAQQTIDGVRALERAFPKTRTLLGISNVSFGLPLAGREVLNSVFLRHAVEAGLDVAIVNSERLVRYPSIDEIERTLAENLIRGRGAEALTAFVAHFRERSAGADRPDAAPAGSPAERLEACVVTGSKTGLVATLDSAMESAEFPSPLDIVNGPLMAGMAEVGRLFNENQLIVAEVLESASVMHAAVAHLEPHLPQGAASGRGKVLLATVKGDVHDIGKNLVRIIFSNNGFDVVDLGIKVPPDRLLAAVEEHRPDLIGLSGLLVRSAHEMRAAAEDLRAAGVTVPLLVGGAALSPAFTARRIAPAYGAPVAHARDVLHGLDLARRFRDPDARPALLDALEAEHARILRTPSREARRAVAGVTAGSSDVTHEGVEIPAPPHTDRVVLDAIDPDVVWPWLNRQMLYAKHLGIRGSVERLAERGDENYRRLEEVIEGVKETCRDGGMQVRAVYRWVPVTSDKNRIVVWDPESGAERAHLDFPRQARGKHLCLADFVVDRPDTLDVMGLFVTTAGPGISERVARLRDEGRYLESHALGALAVETAEAAAEWLHADMRRQWGIPDPDDTTLGDAFAGRFRGQRLSLGYPACPDLEQQAVLFDLLEPAEIGVALTDGFMMDPEASVSALVFHHPQARTFAV